LDPPAGRGRGGFYYDSHLQRLLEIKALQNRGLRLAAIQEMFKKGEAPLPATDREVPYGLSLTLNINDAPSIQAVESPSHLLKIEIGGDPIKVSFYSETVRMDRDFILYCRRKEGTRSRAYSFQSGDERFMLDLLLDNPRPAGEASAEVDHGGLDREVVFLLDCSGSMSGDSIKEAKSALEISLRALPEGAHFNLYRFGSNYQTLYKESKELTEAGLREALAYLKNTEANLGGTELLAPLQAILETPIIKASRSILLITDGEIGNEEEVIHLMDQHRASTRLFTLGIGAGPNECLVKALSRTGSGAYEFIFPGERIEPKVLRVFEKLLRKGISDPVIQWGTGAIQAPEFSTLFPGYPATFFARLENGVFPDKVRLGGEIAGQSAAWEVEVIPCDEPVLPIPVLWARERIRDLEGKMSGTNAHQSGGKADEDRDLLKQEAVAISRVYGILSRETDFVAVEERAEADKTMGEVAVRKVPALVTGGWHGISVLRDVGARFCLSAERAPESEYYFSEVEFDITIGAVSKIGHEEDDIILRVLKQQQVAGGFLLDKCTAKLLGLDLKALTKLAGKITTSGEVDRLPLLSTAIVLHILETRYADRRGLWEGLLKKSVAWLRDQLARTNPVLEGRKLKAWVADFLQEGKPDE
jgi:hypothetical protein